MTEACRKYLVFTLAGRRFAFDLAQVAEVEEQPVTWPIPMAPRCYPGAMNFHGTIVAVMDLALFLGLSGSQVPEKVIVIDTCIASLAFLVEQVIRIVSVNQADIQEGTDGPFATAQVYLPDGGATLLDAAAIAERAGETINA
ncbi:MAG: chemotaxis protein CheW [Geobacteraceae bacterium]|nr:chemotaxis protein CheW [Geobacteraceae bacterium]